jgi:hypothetical protein
VVGIGTGPDEWRVGPEEFRAQIEWDFAQSEALSLNYEPLVVSEAGPVPWGARSLGCGPSAWPSGRLGRPRSRSRSPSPGRNPARSSARSRWVRVATVPQQQRSPMVQTNRRSSAHRLRQHE